MWFNEIITCTQIIKTVGVYVACVCVHKENKLWKRIQIKYKWKYTHKNVCLKKFSTKIRLKK